MDFVKALTPKDTEEVREGLFIQRRLGKYRQVYPAAWNGKMNWYNLFTGGSIWKSRTFILILLIVFAYSIDVKNYKDFYEETINNPLEFCQSVWEKNPSGINDYYEVTSERGNPNTLPGYPG